MLSFAIITEVITKEGDMAISREALEAGGVDLSDAIDASAGALPPIAPGALLREEWLDPLGITPYRLAKDIDVPPNRVTAILAGARAISADTALRLARYFGTDAQSWMNLQAQYDLATERRQHGEEIARAVRPRVAA
jgi:addiction module HigA family antidote